MPLVGHRWFCSKANSNTTLARDTHNTHLGQISHQASMIRADSGLSYAISSLCLSGCLSASSLMQTCMYVYVCVCVYNVNREPSSQQSRVGLCIPRSEGKSSFKTPDAADLEQTHVYTPYRKRRQCQARLHYTR